MARCIHMRGDRDFLMSFNHASMANAMPHAMGAQALDRSRQVIALCGDGGFSMLMGDFITAVNYDLPIKCAVFNNGILGLVKMEMESMGYPEWGIDLKNPSFAACGEAMGGTGIRVEDPADLEDAVKKALATDGPVVLDVLTNRNELTMPPNLIPAKAWGFLTRQGQGDGHHGGGEDSASTIATQRRACSTPSSSQYNKPPRMSEGACP